MEKPSRNASSPELTRQAANTPETGSPQSDKVRCSSCRGIIEASDEYCRHCGRRQARSGTWYYEPVAIAVLALTVLGPFALPLVWKSPRLSRNAKWAWTAVLTVLTAVLLYCLWFVCALLFAQYRELNDVLRQIR